MCLWQPIGDMGTSCTEQFNINVAPVVPPSCDVGHELRQVHTAILRHISLLRKVYHMYSSLEAPLSSHENRLGNVMTRMQVSTRGGGDCGRGGCGRGQVGFIKDKGTCIVFKVCGGLSTPSVVEASTLAHSKLGPTEQKTMS